MKLPLFYGFFAFILAGQCCAETGEEIQLLDQLRSRNGETRVIAAEGLGQLSNISKEVIRILKRRITKGTYEERVGAAWAFGEIKKFDPGLVAILQKQLNWEISHGNDPSLVLILEHTLRERWPQGFNACLSLLPLLAH